jgi:hypothetical protein
MTSLKLIQVLAIFKARVAQPGPSAVGVGGVRPALCGEERAALSGPRNEPPLPLVMFSESEGAHRDSGRVETSRQRFLPPMPTQRVLPVLSCRKHRLYAHNTVNER